MRPLLGSFDSTLPPVFFYGKTVPEFFFLSNFWPAVITVDGVEWPTTEHYYQAAKDPKLADQIRTAATAAKAKALGQTAQLHPNWDLIKIDVMCLALAAKFTQHLHLRELLLATGQRQLVEHTSRDAIWGDGADGPTVGTGQNLLGNCLMETRFMLSGAPQDMPFYTLGLKRLRLMHSR